MLSRLVILLAVIGFSTLSVFAQSGDIESLLKEGQAQFAAARGAGQLDVAQLDAAEATFARALQLNPDDARALVWHGMLLTIKSGRLFQAGQLGEAQPLLQRGFEEMDRGIKLAPENGALRRLRGETNMRVPEFLNRTALAVEDLQFFVSSPAFSELKSNQQAQSYLFLGSGYLRLGKPDQARQAWQKAIEIAPDTPVAKEARKRLDGLAPAAGTSSNRARPDRLNGIPDNVGPIMAVASIAFKPGTVPGTDVKADNELFTALQQAPGFMGMRVLTSEDKTPMFVIISWWKDKAALVDWYYNPAHQKIIQQFSYSGNDEHGKGTPAVKDVITHIGIQFYTPLKGGGSVGEAFGPRRKPVE